MPGADVAAPPDTPEPDRLTTIGLRVVVSVCQRVLAPRRRLTAT